MVQLENGPWPGVARMKGEWESNGARFCSVFKSTHKFGAHAVGSGEPLKDLDLARSCGLEILLWGAMKKDLKVCGKACRSFFFPYGCPQ